MTGRLTEGVYSDADARMADVDARVAKQYPGERHGRQPIHTVYVPAGRFHPELAGQWGEQAKAVFAGHGGEPAALAEALGVDPALTAEVHGRVVAKLGTEPIEDLRIDFEDGYGNPGDETEDADALAAGAALAESVKRGQAPPFTGIRFKSFEQASRRRGIRTLDVFLSGLLDGGPLPAGFVVTLPKITAIEQVETAVEVLAKLETAYGLDGEALRFEVQVETVQSILTGGGTAAVSRIVRAGAGRLSALHYGTYDYSAGLGISAAYQSMDHPAADFAKAFMQVAAAGTGVWLSDGSTNRIPVGDADAVLAAWREQVRLVRRSLRLGFYQGWDLHPHQLPSRYLATYVFYREGFRPAAARLRDYAARTEGGVLDEPATAQALAAYLCRGLDCGALSQSEVDELTGLDRAALDAYRRRETP